MSVILVTGASRGIGAHLCRSLHAAGHRVFAGVRRPDASTEWADLVGVRDFDAVPLDVTDDHQATEAVSRILRQTGKLDVLINNAGVAWLAPVELQSSSLLRDVMETNFFGALRMMRAVLPGMRRQRSGRIINISSLAAFHGLPAEAAYCASKSALDTAAQALALEVERFGIFVTSIRPGYTTTGLATSDVAEDVARDTEYEPLLRHLENLYRQSAQAAESPDLIVSAVERTIASDKPLPRIELGQLAAAVEVVRQGDPVAQLDSMRAVNAMEWWRNCEPSPSMEEAG